MSISAIGSTSTYSFVDRMIMNSTKSSSKTQSKEDVSEMVSNILAKDDTDGDGKLSASEVKFDSEMFGNLDTDGDGLLPRTS